MDFVDFHSSGQAAYDAARRPLTEEFHAPSEQVIRPSDWNDMLIKVEGNQTAVILNGIQILDFTDPAPKSSDGYIALQLHSGGLGNMRFKDIIIRDLSVR